MIILLDNQQYKYVDDEKIYKYGNDSELYTLIIKEHIYGAVVVNGSFIAPIYPDFIFKYKTLDEIKVHDLAVMKAKMSFDEDGIILQKGITRMIRLLVFDRGDFRTPALILFHNMLGYMTEDKFQCLRRVNSNCTSTSKFTIYFDDAWKIMFDDSVKLDERLLCI